MFYKRMGKGEQRHTHLLRINERRWAGVRLSAKDINGLHKVLLKNEDRYNPLQPWLRDWCRSMVARGLLCYNKEEGYWHISDYGRLLLDEIAAENNRNKGTPYYASVGNRKKIPKELEKRKVEDAHKFTDPRNFKDE